MLVAGVDSSTRSTKVLLCQADDGAIVGQASAPHPDGTECDPELWWDALAKAGAGLLDRADAIGVAAQQHGMVVIDETGQVIGPPCSGTTSGPRRRPGELIAELGGPRQVGTADRERPDGLLHGHQAALAGGARTGGRRQDRTGAAPARLADLAAGGPHR